MIWDYEPDYKFLEEPKVDHVMISSEKELNEIIKPYKLIYKQEDQLLGTVSNITIEQILSSFKEIELQHIKYEKIIFELNEVNQLLVEPGHLTLFFASDIPLEAFTQLFKFNSKEAPNAFIDRFIINTNQVDKTNEVEFLFVSSISSTVYSAKVDLENVTALKKVIVDQTENMFVYNEFPRENELSLYLPKDSQEVIQFTYFIDEYPHDLFNSVLFSNTSIVQKDIETNTHTTLEKYSDDMAVVIYDTNSLIMNYISLANNRFSYFDAATLLKNSYDYVNDHGGFSADFRLSSINTTNNIVEYQMYFQGYPVYSANTLTRIVTTWGETQINRYRRPYYSLDTDITTVKTVKTILAGADVMDYLQNPNFAKMKIDEVFVGYHLEKDESTNVFVLEPSWFAMSEGNWIRITSPTPNPGGVSRGLE